MKEERNDELADGPLRLIHVFLSLSLPKKIQNEIYRRKKGCAVCDDGAGLGVCLLLSDISNVINRYLSL
jgi:hypothetical protein